MLEPLTSTTSPALSFGNTTLALASPTAFIFDANTTDFWNVTERIIENVMGSCDPENPEFNCTVEEYIRRNMGPKQLPLETAIWVSSYCLLSLWRS